MPSWSIQNQGILNYTINPIQTYFNRKGTRINYAFLEDGSKVRIAKKSGALIPKPDRSDLKYMNRTKKKEAGTNDTKPEDVLEKTYKGEDFLRVRAEFDEYIRMKEEKEGLLVFKEPLGGARMDPQPARQAQRLW